jgi:hypothetical protein
MKRYCPLLKYHMSMILLMIVSLKNIILGWILWRTLIKLDLFMKNWALR